MLTFLGRKQPFCDGIHRRDFLKLGALSVGGLTLPALLQAKAANGAQGAEKPIKPATCKSVIMIYLPGGPTHMDTYDLKPDSPKEFRGELNPMRTNVPGVGICELMPKQAGIMDKLAVLRGVQFVNEHSAHLVMTGFPDKVLRPAFGTVVSKMKAAQDGLPPYVSLMNDMRCESPEYIGAAHRPFVPSGPGLANLSLVSGINRERLEDRKTLLSTFDTMRRDMDNTGTMAGMDSFTGRALDIVTSPNAREAFDIRHESEKVKAKYGKENISFLQARRLVEAGVSVVTLATGGWDTHSNNFQTMRQQLPRVDQGVHALVTDLHERGLDKEVAVVMWGEFGRSPRISSDAGRDHWPAAGFALVAGGGLNMGQAIGESDARGERPKGNPITPSNVLATLYTAMGIDPGATLMDNNGRPMYLLDERETVSGLI